jgi:Uma2 family endonuclease
MRRVMAKARFYLDHGVRQVWLIDPIRRMVIVLTAPDAARILVEDDTIEGGYLLPEFAVQVREILPEPDGEDDE